MNLEYLKESVEKAFPSWVFRHLKYAAQAVNVIRLDDLKLAPDLVKTDVEGFEYEVLSGLRQTITACRRLFSSSSFRNWSTCSHHSAKNFHIRCFSMTTSIDRFVPV